MAEPAYAHTSLFQKTLTDLDIAFFCFPKDQPVHPFNCSLVSLQMLRIISPVESNALIPKYPTGLPLKNVEHFIKTNYNLNILFTDHTVFENIGDYIENSIIPGYATLLVLRSDPKDLTHTVIYHKNPAGLTFLIDPQTGKIYEKNEDEEMPDEGGVPGIKILRPLSVFLRRHGINRVFVFRYVDTYNLPSRLTIESHNRNSQHMDNIIASVALNSFQDRGARIAAIIASIPVVRDVPLVGARKTKKRRVKR